MCVMVQILAHLALTENPLQHRFHTVWWNFATRTGSVNASFDGAKWNGVGVIMPIGRNDFGGAGVGDNGRILTMQGAFFHNASSVQTPATPLSAPNTPAAVGGLFGIRGAGYGANGIFVGGRR